MRLLAVIHPPEATRTILECLDLPARAPPTSAPIPDNSEFEADWEAAFERDRRLAGPAPLPGSDRHPPSEPSQPRWRPTAKPRSAGNRTRVP